MGLSLRHTLVKTVSALRQISLGIEKPKKQQKAINGKEKRN
jgi:hypothetical protein